MYYNIDWDKIKFFKKSEFSEDPDKYADPDLIHILDRFRFLLGERIFPSPVEGAFVRFNGSRKSQHYVGPKDNPVRKTTAIDIFPEGMPIEIYSYLLTFFDIKGLGIYLDTKGVDGLPWIMFHIDIREKGFKAFPLIWFCKKENGINRYYYPQNDSKYWSFLQNEQLYKRKVAGIE